MLETEFDFDIFASPFQEAIGAAGTAIRQGRSVEP